MSRNKAPICRFYQKGYCRYGTSCRFQHPGEENNDDRATDYSSSSKTGFSFARALESTLASGNDIDMSDNPSQSIFSQSYQQLQQQQLHQTPQYINSSFSPFSFKQQHQQLQQTTQIDGNFSPFSFQQRQQQLFQQHQQQQQQQQAPQQINSIFSPFSSTPQQHNQQVFQQQNLQNQQNQLSFQHPQQQPQQAQAQQPSGLELSEAELRAFQADKFEFRKIPIRAPAPALC